MLKRVAVVFFAVFLSAMPALAKGKALDLKQAIPPGFDQALGDAFIQDDVARRYPQGQMPPLEFIGLLSRSFEKVGVDYSATVVKTLRNVTPRKWQEMLQDGTLDVIFLPFASADKAGVLDEAISKGFVTVEAATTACETSNAMGGKCNWKPKASASSAPKPAQKGQATQSSQQAARAICATVVKVEELPGLLGQAIFISNENLKYNIYYFDINDDACSDIIKPDNFICFDIEGVRKNTLGLEAMGVTSPAITFIGNCRTPG